MRAFWKKGQVVSLKLAENIYTVTQMIDDDRVLAFFKLFKEEDNWQSINLNNEKILFIAPTVNIVRAFGERKIPNTEIVALTDVQTPEIKICSFLNKIENFHNGEYYLRGGRLLQTDGNENITLKENLDVIKDREDILKYEFDNLYVHEHIRARLLFNQMYNQDFDFFKDKIFPNLYDKSLQKKFIKMAKKFDINF